MAQKILITGASNPITYQLAWHLKSNDIHFCDTQNHVNIIPSAASNSFAHQFLNYCLNHQIQIVFALKANEQQALNQSKILFDEFGISLMQLDEKQLANINQSDFIHHDFKNSNSINSFTDFSASVLNAGYPNKKVWFGRADGLGNIYQINDHVPASNFLWLNSTSLSFTQASKLVNQNPFVPIHIYPAKENILVCKVLLFNQQVFTLNILTNIQLEIINKSQKTFNLQGFLELAFADDRLIYIKNVSYDA
ncbi:MAG: hypothetical protein EAZ15_05460 [Sphingobacteriales bacterium]|nr:MAG: hypothetical protein EAZ15_05460 [Sphingobacteriales bacterium]